MKTKAPQQFKGISGAPTRTRESFIINGLNGSHRNKIVTGKEKPGAAATATGSCGEGSENTHNTTTHGNLSIPGVIEQLFSNRLISVARSVLYGLTGFKERGTTDKLASLYAMRLTREERLFMAWAALQSLDEKDAYIVATANLYGVYGGEVI